MKPNDIAVQKYHMFVSDARVADGFFGKNARVTEYCQKQRISRAHPAGSSVLIKMKNTKMDTYSLLRYFGCRMTKEEEGQLHAWLLDDRDGNHAKMYREAHKIFEGMTLYYDDKVLVVSSKDQLWKRVVKYAAQIAVVILIVAGCTLLGQDMLLKRFSSEYETILVPAGERMEMVLADGTHLWMNSCTEVQCPLVFSRKNRSIRVNDGEVLLDVAEDNRRPFVVDTWAGEIKVLGTRFDVAVDEDNKEFTAALFRGSIEVSNKFKPETYVLQPNDIVKMLDGSFCVERVRDMSAVDSWSRGLMDVTSVPFDKLMSQFEKAFDVNIVIDREELPVVTYTRGKIRLSEGIDHAMSVLQLASEFSYTIDRETNTVLIR